MNKESKSESPLIGERSAEDINDAEVSVSTLINLLRNDELRPIFLYHNQGLVERLKELLKAKEESLPEATEKPNAYKWIASLVTKHQMSVEDWNLGPMSKRNYRAIYRQIEQHNESLKEVAIQLKHAFEKSKEDNKAFGEQEDTDKMFKEWIGDTGAADENQSELWAAAFKVLGFFPSPSKFKSVQEDFHITRKPE